MGIHVLIILSTSPRNEKFAIRTEADIGDTPLRAHVSNFPSCEYVPHIDSAGNAVKEVRFFFITYPRYKILDIRAEGEINHFTSMRYVSNLSSGKGFPYTRKAGRAYGFATVLI